MGWEVNYLLQNKIQIIIRVDQGKNRVWISVLPCFRGRHILLR